MDWHAIDSTPLSKSNALREQVNKSLITEALESAAYSCFQGPLSSTVQIVDKVFNTEAGKSVHFMEPPEQADLGSSPSRWHAQQIGSAAGMIVPFLLLHKGVGQITTKVIGEVKSGEAMAVLNNRAIGESFATGALYEGLLKPVDQKEVNFAATRTRNAIAGGATFATIAGASIGIKRWGMTESGNLGSFLRNDIYAAMLAGIPGGIVNAEAHSYLTGNGPATRKHLVESMYSFAFISGSLAFGKIMTDGRSPERTLVDETELHSSAERGDSTQTAPIGTSSIQALVDRLFFGRPQLAMAGFEPAFIPSVELNAVYMSKAKASEKSEGINARELLKTRERDLPANEALEAVRLTTEQALIAIRQVKERAQLQENIKKLETKIKELETREYPPDLDDASLAASRSKRNSQLHGLETKLEDAYQNLHTSQRLSGWLNLESSVRKAAEAVAKSIDLVAREPNAAKKQALASESVKVLEPLIEQMPKEIKGKTKSSGSTDPLSQLIELNSELEGQLTKHDRRDQLRQALKPVVESQVVGEIIKWAQTGKGLSQLSPRAKVVFMSGDRAADFSLDGRIEVGFTVKDCADANLLQARLGGQEITGAVVFVPQRSSSTEMVTSRVLGQVPARTTCNTTYSDFIRRHTEIG